MSVTAPRWSRFLPQPLVHQIAVVGGALPCWMGLGPILFPWNTGQRFGDEGALAGVAPFGQSAVKRRGGGSGGKPIDSALSGYDGGWHVDMVGWRKENYPIRKTLQTACIRPRSVGSTGVAASEPGRASKSLPGSSNTWGTHGLAHSAEVSGAGCILRRLGCGANAIRTWFCHFVGRAPGCLSARRRFG